MGRNYNDVVDVLTHDWMNDIRRALFRQVSSDWMVLVERFYTYNEPSKRKNSSNVGP